MSDRLWIRYLFRLMDGTEKRFEVALDRSTLDLVTEGQKTPPPWARLSNHQCPNCPLDVKKTACCPVAQNLSEIIGFFKDFLSYEEADLTIETDRRTYQMRTSLQKGLSSLIGIYMVTSGCPILDHLRPMVRFHQPLADILETQYRVLSMYLLAQYFISRKGNVPDWGLKGLTKIYDEIRLVNISFCKRISKIAELDAVPNAVVILNNFAESLVFSLDTDSLAKIEGLFAAYLTE